MSTLYGSAGTAWTTVGSTVATTGSLWVTTATTTTDAAWTEWKSDGSYPGKETQVPADRQEEPFEFEEV